MNNKAGTYYSTYAVTFLIILFLVLICARNGIRINSVSHVQYNAYECFSSKNSNNGVLNLLVYSESTALELANALCQNSIVQNSYHKVYVTWGHRGRDELRIIFDQPYQLFLSKPELIERLEFNLNEGYVPIGAYKDSISRFISKESQPILSEEYLKGKKLGLLNNSNSLSGNRIPRQAIKNAGINEQFIEFRYFNSHKGLIHGLISSEVDLIATGSTLTSTQLQAIKYYKLDIKKGLKGLRWYLHPQLFKTDIHCQIMTILEKISAEPFYQKMEVIAQCGH